MKSRIWTLKLLLIASVLAISAFGVALIPSFPMGLTVMYDWPVASWAFTFGATLAVLSYWAAAFFAWRLLNLIPRQIAFTQQAIHLIIRLKWTVAIMAGALAVGLPQWYRIADIADAPGVMIIGLGFFAIPMIVWIFLMILQQLWEQALSYKTENDMTI